MLSIKKCLINFILEGLSLMKKLLSSLLVGSILFTSCFGLHCFAENKNNSCESIAKVVSNGTSNDGIEKDTLLESVEATEKMIKADNDIKKVDKNKFIEKLEDAKKELKKESKFISIAKVVAKYAAVLSIPFILGYVFGEAKSVSPDLRDNKFRLFWENLKYYFPFLRGFQNFYNQEVSKSVILQGMSEQSEIGGIYISNWTKGIVPSSFISFLGKFVVTAVILVKPVYDYLKLLKDFKDLYKK